jgi:hypothetical protein
MGNCYYRYEFIADCEEAFQLGDICFPEWDALIGSWPTQIEAAYYGAASLAAELDESWCECVPAEDDECCTNDCNEGFLIGCSSPPTEDRIYTFPDGHQITVCGVINAFPYPDGGHFLETSFGERFAIAPTWLCLQFS